MNKFTIAIIGRPNVGKSTLFNRLTKARSALVHDQPGVTRDRKEAESDFFSKTTKIIDTPGLEECEKDSLEFRMMKQTEKAIQDANICFLVIDGKVGLTYEDKFFAKWLRKKNSEVIVVANKCETKMSDMFSDEIYQLGFNKNCFVSAEHSIGIDQLYLEVEKYLKDYLEQQEIIDDQDKPVKIAIIGRPNVGKSTFLNKILKEERLLTGPEAGITRDSITIEWTYRNRPIHLIDTAGVRKKSKIDSKLEKMTVSDTKIAIDYSQVVVLMIDALQPFEKQDISIADIAIKEGRAVVFAINKWDKIKDKEEYKKFVDKTINQLFKPIAGVKVVYLSALNNNNINDVIDAALLTYEFWNKRISTAKLNEWLQFAQSKHSAPLGAGGKQVKIKYITQGKTRPPTFMLFVNRPKDLYQSYIRYLTNSLREAFNLPGVPLRLLIRSSNNPYHKK